MRLTSGGAPKSAPPLRLGLVAGFLLLLAIAASAAGQYILNRPGPAKPNLALTLYAAGVTAFLAVMAGQRRGFWLSPGTLAVERRLHSWQTAELALAAILLSILSMLAINVPATGPLAALAWALSLACLLGAAWPIDTPRVPGASSAWPARLRRFAVSLLTREAVLAGTILVCGAILRLYRLADFPNGIHGDETGLGLSAASILQGKGPNPFGISGFLDLPAGTAYLQAAAMLLFGHTITALRLAGAVPGTLSLVVFYLLVRDMFGTRPALLALALLAGNAVHMHLSRLGLFFGAVWLASFLSLYCLWKAQHWRSAGWWLAAGISTGLQVYVFPGIGVPLLIAGGYFVYLVTSQPARWREWARAAGLLIAGGAASIAPMAALLRQTAYAFLRHGDDKFIFSPGGWARTSALYHSTHASQVLLGQIKANIQPFFSPVFGGDFFPFRHAFLVPVLAPLAVMGMVLCMARLRDPRHALLAVWFCIAFVAGGVLTIDAPQAHREYLAIPAALAGVALVLDWLLDAVPRSIIRPAAPLAGLIIAAIPLIAGGADVQQYFGSDTATRPFEPTTLQGEYVAALGTGYEVYSMGTPAIYFDHSVTRFLAPTVAGASLFNAGASLPEAAPADRDLAFLVFPWQDGYLGLLESQYPTARLTPIQGKTGTVFTSVLVPRAGVVRWRGLSAHYPSFERVEANADGLGGANVSYPAAVSWSGSLYVDHPGQYAFGFDGAGGDLRIDGQSVGRQGQTELVSGWHSLLATGLLPSSEARASVKWAPAGAGLAAIDARWLDARSLRGSLHARITTADGVVHRRYDGAIAFRETGLLWQLKAPASAAWDGMLTVDKPGKYTLELDAAGTGSVTLDGQPVILKRGGAPASGTPFLAGGPHQLTVTYDWHRGLGSVELYWTPPGGQRTIIPPEFFSPSR